MASNTDDTPQNQPPQKKNLNQDLPDSQHDLDRMQSEEVTIDLPDVKDIPGQEHIHVMPLGELADSTISSDDEEGEGLFEDEEEDEIDAETQATGDVSRTEKRM